MDIRDRLRNRLAALDGLIATQGLGRAGVRGRALPASITALWETEKRLIRRILDEPADPLATLQQWHDRTENFQQRFPDREGWTDQQGNEWNAMLVLNAIANVMGNIESWTTTVEEFDEDGDDGDEEIE